MRRMWCPQCKNKTTLTFCPDCMVDLTSSPPEVQARLEAESSARRTDVVPGYVPSGAVAPPRRAVEFEAPQLDDPHEARRATPPLAQPAAPSARGSVAEQVTRPVAGLATPPLPMAAAPLAIRETPALPMEPVAPPSALAEAARGFAVGMGLVGVLYLLSQILH
jgi:hypothetical protein